MTESRERKWKDKYLDALENQEQQEAQWQAKVHSFQRLNQLMAAALKGEDSTLDSALVSILKGIDKGSDSQSLHIQLEAFSTLVNSFVASRAKAASNIAAELSVLIDALEGCAKERQQKRRLKALRSQLKSMDHSGVAVWLPQFSDALAVALTIDSQSGDPSLEQPAGYLARVFQMLFARERLDASHRDSQANVADSTPKIENTEASSDLQSTSSLEEQSRNEPAPKAALDSDPVSSGELTATPQLQSSSLDTDIPSPHVSSTSHLSIGGEDLAKKRIAEEDITEEGRTEFAAIGAEVAAVIVEMVARVEVPDRVSDLSEQLLNDVQIRFSIEQLLPSLEALTDIVTAALAQVQSEFSGFLQLLEQRLEPMQTLLANWNDHEQAARSSARTLQEQLEQGFVSMRRALEHESDIDGLKDNIDQQLMHMAESLLVFEGHREAATEPLQAEIAAMQSRIDELEAFSRQAKDRLEKQEKKILSDSLTGIPNREAYTLRAQQEFDRWQRYKRPLAYAICDIDFFKNINDSYGHAAGDKVLKIVAALLTQSLRKTDFMARIGGEEFVILLPETPLEAGKISMEKLRAAIADSPFHFQGEKVSITASFGLTELREGDSLEKVFDRADSALYRAKGEGRNRCITA